MTQRGKTDLTPMNGNRDRVQEGARGFFWGAVREEGEENKKKTGVEKGTKAGEGKRVRGEKRQITS